MFFCQKQFFTLLLFNVQQMITIYERLQAYTSSSNLSHSQAIQGVVAMEANKNVQSSSTPPMKGLPLTFHLEQEVEISFIVRVSIQKLNNCIKTKLIDIKSFFVFLQLAKQRTLNLISFSCLLKAQHLQSLQIVPQQINYNFFVCNPPIFLQSLF